MSDYYKKYLKYKQKYLKAKNMIGGAINYVQREYLKNVKFIKGNYQYELEIDKDQETDYKLSHVSIILLDNVLKKYNFINGLDSLIFYYPQFVFANDKLDENGVQDIFNSFNSIITRCLIRQICN